MINIIFQSFFLPKSSYGLVYDSVFPQSCFYPKNSYGWVIILGLGNLVYDLGYFSGGGAVLNTQKNWLWLG